MTNVIERWLDNRRLSPFRDLSQMQESVDRLFNEFMNWRQTNGLSEAGFAPSCEIVEEEKDYVLKFDMPGVAKENIRVEAKDDRLTIFADRKEEKRRDEKRRHLSEVFYGAYERTFTLPGPVEEKRIDAKLENGVLTITVPKSESTRSKQIPIH